MHLQHLDDVVYPRHPPDPVRVVAIGGSVAKITSSPSSKDWSSLSVVLCGGTHLRNTKDAVGFALLEEQGIQVARRTVAKYRESMGIASSSQRKRFENTT